jgi:hypothetical protein
MGGADCGHNTDPCVQIHEGNTSQHPGPAIQTAILQYCSLRDSSKKSCCSWRAWCVLQIMRRDTGAETTGIRLDIFNNRQSIDKEFIREPIKM